MSGVISPAVRGSKGGGDTMVVVGNGGAAAPAVALGSRPGVGSGGLDGGDGAMEMDCWLVEGNRVSVCVRWASASFRGLRHSDRSAPHLQEAGDIPAIDARAHRAFVPWRRLLLPAAAHGRACVVDCFVVSVWLSGIRAASSRRRLRRSIESHAHYQQDKPKPIQSDWIRSMRMG